MTVYAPHRNHIDDDTAARLHTTITALYRGGQPVEEAMRYTERVCSAANCEFDPDGIDIVTEVYGGRYDGSRVVGAVPYVPFVDATPIDIGTVDATAEDATPVEIDTRVDLDEVAEDATPVETVAPVATSDATASAKSAKKK